MSKKTNFKLNRKIIVIAVLYIVFLIVLKVLNFYPEINIFHGLIVITFSVAMALFFQYINKNNQKS